MDRPPRPRRAVWQHAACPARDITALGLGGAARLRRGRPLREPRVLRRDRPARAARHAARVDVRERRRRARLRGRGRPAVDPPDGRARRRARVRRGVPGEHPDGRRLAIAAGAEQAAAYGRLPLQIPLVLWALKSARCRTARNTDVEEDHRRRGRARRPRPPRLREFDVARIQSPFLGQTALVCLIEDTPTAGTRIPPASRSRSKCCAG